MNNNIEGSIERCSFPLNFAQDKYLEYLLNTNISLQKYKYNKPSFTYISTFVKSDFFDFSCDYTVYSEWKVLSTIKLAGKFFMRYKDIFVAKIFMRNKDIFVTKICMGYKGIFVTKFL